MCVNIALTLVQLLMQLKYPYLYPCIYIVFRYIPQFFPSKNAFLEPRRPYFHFDFTCSHTGGAMPTSCCFTPWTLALSAVIKNSPHLEGLVISGRLQFAHWTNSIQVRVFHKVSWDTSWQKTNYSNITNETTPQKTLCAVRKFLQAFLNLSQKWSAAKNRTL